MAFPAGWSGYWELTFNASAISESPGFVYIPLSDAPSGFWDALDDAGDSDGETIRVSDDTNALIPAYVLPSFNLGARTGALFIFGGGISASVDTDYRVWGGGTASAPAVTDPEGRNATFSAYAGVYFPGVLLTDLTGNGRDLTAVNSPGTTASGYEGLLAATYVSASSQYHHTTDGTQAVAGWPLSAEVVATPGTEGASGVAFGLGNTVGTSNLFLVSFSGAASLDPIEVAARGASGSYSPALGLDYTASTRYYVSGNRDANTGTTSVYVDGALSDTDSTTVAAPSINTMSIGAWRRGGAVGSYFTGSVTAAYISASVRSADYVATMDAMWDGSIHTVGSWVPSSTDTGWFLFQTAANVSGGDTAWTNVNNALDDDADYASIVLSNEDDSDFLVLTNPAGISIPSGATISDIEFRIKRYGDDIRDQSIRAVKGGTQVGNNLADTGTDWIDSDVTVDYGGGLLGTTWADTDFDSDFGVAIQVNDQDIGSDDGRVITVWGRISWNGIVGSGDVALGNVEVSGAGTMRQTGSGAVVLGNVEVAGAGTAQQSGSGAVVLGNVEVAATGAMSLVGSGAIVLGGVEASGQGDGDIIGSGDITLGSIETYGHSDLIGETDWMLFQIAESTGTGVPWDDPENALEVGVDSAHCADMEDGSTSQLLRFKSPILPTAIPPLATILSVAFRARYSLSSGGSTVTTLTHLQAIKGDVAVGDELSGGGTTSGPNQKDFGSGLLGTMWDPSDIDEDAGFEMRVETESNPPQTGSARVYTAWMKVTFTPPADAIVGSGAIVLGGVEIDGQQTLFGSGDIVLGGVEVNGEGDSDCSCCLGYTMANLLELRKRLVKESGHLELVTDAANNDYADNGADEFIRGGQRFCDDQFQYHKSEAWFYKKMAAGQTLVTFNNARIIKEAWLNYADGCRTLLTRKTLGEMRELYADPSVANETSGKPLYWTPAVLGLAPQQIEEDAASFLAEGIVDYDHIYFGNHYPYKGLYIMPPPDTDYTVQVRCEWYSFELCEDEDVSFWSQYPEILMMAARREMEIHLHRNTTGAQDFERPLLHSLQKLYHNMIAEESSGPTKMRRG